jgi:hypothetical protein
MCLPKRFMIIRSFLNCASLRTLLSATNHLFMFVIVYCNYYPICRHKYIVIVPTYALHKLLLPWQLQVPVEWQDQDTIYESQLVGKIRHLINYF